MLLLTARYLLLQPELFHEPQMHLFGGQLVTVIQATEQPGRIIVEAGIKGLKSATVELLAK